MGRFIWCLTPQARIPNKLNDQVPFSIKIKNNSILTTGIVELITHAVQAEEIPKKEKG